MAFGKITEWRLYIKSELQNFFARPSAVSLLLQHQWPDANVRVIGSLTHSFENEYGILTIRTL